MNVVTWNVEYYEDKDGFRPVEEFIDSLSIKEQAKVFQRVLLLKEHGPNLGFPFSSQIEGRLRELRLQFGKADYRILYYGDARRNFVLLHAFRKHTAQTPKREIETALKRMNQDNHAKGGNL